MDDVEDLDTWPLDGVVMSYLRDAAATVKTFDLCALCRVKTFLQLLSKIVRFYRW